MKKKKRWLSGTSMLCPTNIMQIVIRVGLIPNKRGRSVNQKVSKGRPTQKLTPAISCQFWGYQSGDRGNFF
jgi:hypothetical protein